MNYVPVMLGSYTSRINSYMRSWVWMKCLQIQRTWRERERPTCNMQVSCDGDIGTRAKDLFKQMEDIWDIYHIDGPAPSSALHVCLQSFSFYILSYSLIRGTIPVAHTFILFQGKRENAFARRTLNCNLEHTPTIITLWNLTKTERSLVFFLFSTKRNNNVVHWCYI